jgi:hypothetical protein
MATVSWMDAPRPDSPLSLDTSADAERLQIRLWREMSPADKARLVSGLCESAHALALAGIRRRHPTASPRECFLRLAALTLGVELARRAYPELADISDVP